MNCERHRVTDRRKTRQRRSEGFDPGEYLNRVGEAFASPWPFQTAAKEMSIISRRSPPSIRFTGRIVSSHRCPSSGARIFAVARWPDSDRSTGEMKPDHDDRLEAGGDFRRPIECFIERLQPREIVGEVANPVLETVRRSWWRAFDRVCGFFVLLRLSIHDRAYGPEPPTPADLLRGADHERLVRTFPMTGETIEPRNDACPG